VEGGEGKDLYSGKIPLLVGSTKSSSERNHRAKIEGGSGRRSQRVKWGILLYGVQNPRMSGFKKGLSGAEDEEEGSDKENGNVKEKVP